MGSVLADLLQGKNAHTNSLHCVDVPAEVAGQLLLPLPHSIWQLVWHMDYWMAHELARIGGHPAPYPEHAALSWPTAEPPSVDAWQDARSQFRTLLEQLEALTNGSAAERGRVLAADGPQAGSRDFTVEEVLWQTAVHNSHHLGQVVLVRRAIGAWPPKEGSDTW